MSTLMASHSNKPKAIFMGTPEFAVPCLEATHAQTELVGVFAQPDRKAGRGMKLQAPPVKMEAERLGLPVFQPESARSQTILDQIQMLQPEVIVVVAYGKILPKELLVIPKYGCINVHGSLLPRWRGASPIQWAIVQGDEQTGVSLMQLDEGMDTGPVLAKKKTDILPNETAGELFVRLSELGAEILNENLPNFFESLLVPEVQVAQNATYAPLLKKEDGKIDWNQQAIQIHNRIRGLSPWPGAFGFFRNKRVKFLKAKVGLLSSDETQRPGSIVKITEEGVFVSSAKGIIVLKELQMEGKQKVQASAFAQGYQCKVGELFS